MRVIGVQVEVMEVKRVGGDKEEGRELVWVRLGSDEQRGQVMERKRRLMGKREVITEDLSWRERCTRCKLREKGWKEQRKGRRVWMENGWIRIDGQWWTWDEEEGVLKDGRGG